MNIQQAITAIQSLRYRGDRERLVYLLKQDDWDSSWADEDGLAETGRVASLHDVADHLLNDIVEGGKAALEFVERMCRDGQRITRHHVCKLDDDGDEQDCYMYGTIEDVRRATNITDCYSIIDHNDDTYSLTCDRNTYDSLTLDHAEAILGLWIMEQDWCELPHDDTGTLRFASGWHHGYVIFHDEYPADFVDGQLNIGDNYFVKKAELEESLDSMQDPDGSWRVVAVAVDPDGDLHYCPENAQIIKADDWRLNRARIG